MTARRRARLTYLPNLISLLRLPIAAVFLVVDGLLWRGILLSLGALTDAADGWVARRFGLKSKTGEVLDPLVDKLFVLGIMATFLRGPYLGWTEFAILAARDLYVGVAFVMGRLAGFPVPARARLSGKVVTFLQMVTLFVLLLASDLIDYCVLAVGVTGAVAIVDYTLAALREAHGPAAEV